MPDTHPPTTPPAIRPVAAVRLIVGFLGKRPGWTALSIGLLLLNIGIELSLPQFLGSTITALSNPSGGRSLGTLVGIFIGLVVLRAVVGLVLGPIRNRTAQMTLGDIRAAVYDSLQRRSFAWHDNARTGELISRAGTDVGRLQDLLFVCLLFGVDVAVGLIGTLSLIFLTSTRLGLMTLVALVPTVATMAWFAAQLQPRWRRVHERHGAMSTVIQENIAGVRVVKAFARESAEITKFRARRAEFLKELAEAVNYWAARVPFAQFLFGLAVPLTLWMGASEVLDGSISLGDLAKVLVYQMALGGRIGVIGQITNILQNSSSAAQRVSELLDDPAPQNADRTNGRISAVEGSIVFDAVDFRYSSEPSLRVLDESKPPTEKRPATPTPSRTQALESASFSVAAGARVAVVGPTGSGKSTLLALIARFYEPAQGRILQTAPTSGTGTATPCAETSVWFFKRPFSSARPSLKTSPSDAPRLPETRLRRPRGRHGPTDSSESWPMATTPSSANEESPSVADNASASPSPAPCSFNLGSYCSTMPPAPSTPPPNKRFARRCANCATAEPHSWWPTGRQPFAPPIKSSFSRKGDWWPKGSTSRS